MAWFALVIAGMLEVVWASSMKQSEGFTRLWPSMVTISTMVASFALLSWVDADSAAQHRLCDLDRIGAVGAFVVGVAILGEAASALRVTAAALIVAGLVLMKLSSPV